MKWNVAIAAVVLANVLGAGSAVAQVVNLGNSGPGGAAIQWQGPQTNARALLMPTAYPPASPRERSFTCRRP